MAFNQTRESQGGRGGHVVDQLSAYLDDELGAGARGGIDTHVQGCAECARELATLRATREVLRGLEPMPTPRSFILSPQMVAPPVEERGNPLLAWLPRLRLATAALAVVLVLVLSADAINSAGLHSTAQQARDAQPALANVPLGTQGPQAAKVPADSTDAAANSSGDATSAGNAMPAPAAMATDTSAAAAAAPTDTSVVVSASLVAEATATPEIKPANRIAGPQPNTTQFSYLYISQGTPEAYSDYLTVGGATQPVPIEQQNTSPTQLNWLWLEVPLGVIIFALIALLLIFSRRGSPG